MSDNIISLLYNTYLVFHAGAWAVPWWRCWAATLRGTSTKESRSSIVSARVTNPRTDFQTMSLTSRGPSSSAVSFAIHVTGRPLPNCSVIRLPVIGRYSGDSAQRFYPRQPTGRARIMLPTSRQCYCSSKNHFSLYIVFLGNYIDIGLKPYQPQYRPHWTKSTTGKVHIGHMSLSATRYRPQTFSKSAVIVMFITRRSHLAYTSGIPYAM